MVAGFKGQTMENNENRALIEFSLSYRFENRVNSLLSLKWLVVEKKIKYDTDHVEELILNGYTIVRVVNIPFNNFEDIVKI